MHAGAGANNERLEFLGDSVIDAIVSDYLCEAYPEEGEGFLTKMRSKMVSRKMLNYLGEELHLLSKLDVGNNQVNPNMAGNALEALVGALYKDLGYATAKTVVLNRVYKPHVDLRNLENLYLNFKSMLVEWCQSRGKTLRYVTVFEETNEAGRKRFTCGVEIDGEIYTQAEGRKKKTAETKAAEEACQLLGLLSD